MVKGKTRKDEFADMLEATVKVNDSLKYARYMQHGILPKRRHFERIWPETSVFYREKDTVSGDFYYIGETRNKVYWSVGDCSGHGIPGAMLTMLGSSFLNYTIQNKQGLSTSDILNTMDEKLCETFCYHDYPEHIDISLLCYNKETNELSFSGARRKLVLIRDNEIVIFKGNSFPLGGIQIEKERMFSEEKITMKKGDFVYIGSDGFQDQFGGENNKKFTSKRLHDLLVDISSYELHLQKIILLLEFNLWRGDQEQIDDVCLMGIGF